MATRKKTSNPKPKPAARTTKPSDTQPTPANDGLDAAVVRDGETLADYRARLSSDR